MSHILWSDSWDSRNDDYNTYGTKHRKAPTSGIMLNMWCSYEISKSYLQLWVFGSKLNENSWLSTLVLDETLNLTNISNFVNFLANTKSKEFGSLFNVVLYSWLSFQNAIQWRCAIYNSMLHYSYLFSMCYIW